ncbi:expressed unknown protein [Seminavis robusta]|uniref:Uncharacterized protein n=1 Tax=Seminavis robusta TaxID=568900 RepID=A0A9N8ERL9_9STRA|nr:expressed unknown protein [Seminavis robusta]|eukprot:Sro1586_g284200.1 n/a (291) ;mRNA; r:10560-11432
MATGTVLKIDVAPRKPRISRGISPKRERNRPLNVQRTTSSGEIRKRGLGRTTSNDWGNGHGGRANGGNATWSAAAAAPPTRGVARASSLRDTRKRGLKRTTSTSNDKENKQPPGLKRTVSFGSEQVRTVQIVDPESKNDVWYTKRQLNTLHKLEIRKNLLHQLQADRTTSSSKKSALENEDCTWRGMENLEKETERLERIQSYVRTVILEHRSETSSEELKRIAKAMSKGERDRAHSMGLKDEMEVKPSPSKIGGRQRIGRTLSGSLSWMKRSNSKLMASSKKGGSATAA